KESSSAAAAWWCRRSRERCYQVPVEAVGLGGACGGEVGARVAVLDAGSPAGELVGEVFSQSAVGPETNAVVFGRSMLSLPGLLVRWHADLLRGSVPGSPVPSNLRPLRNRRMIFAGPAARPAGRAVRRHDAACLGRAGQTGKVIPVSCSDTVH